MSLFAILRDWLIGPILDRLTHDHRELEFRMSALDDAVAAVGTAVSANENKVLIGVLFQVILTVSVVAIPIIMFPILREHNESLALGYVAARIFEGFFYAGCIIALLSILSLSLNALDWNPSIACRS